MEKVKISKKTSSYIDDVLKMYEHDDEQVEKTIIYILKGAFEIDRIILKELGILDLVKAILGDFEIEETPEEKLLSLYNSEGDKDWDAIYKVGIQDALNVLNIKIKGIND